MEFDSLDEFVDDRIFLGNGEKNQMELHLFIEVHGLETFNLLAKI